MPLALSRSLREIEATLFAERLMTLSEDAAQLVAPTRMITLLLAGFAATGLLLAALGVFGTMTYNVSQRARALAIQSALGASRRALGSFLYGVSPTDPWTLAGVVGVLLVLSLVASYRPAATAASVDPMTVLRRD